MMKGALLGLSAFAIVFAVIVGRASLTQAWMRGQFRRLRSTTSFSGWDLLGLYLPDALSPGTGPRKFNKAAASHKNSLAGLLSH